MKSSSTVFDNWPYLLLISLWYVAWATINNEILIPSPHQTVSTLMLYSMEPRFQHAVSATMQNLVIAWSLIQMLVLSTIMIMHASRHAELVFVKWALMFQTLPTFALLPVLIALLGFNTTMMFTLLIFANYWVSISYAITALHETRKQWSHHAENFQWSVLDQVRRIYVPGMIPHLITIWEITWGLCWRTLIAVEVMFGGLGTTVGLGVIMMEDRQTYDTAEVWAVLLVILTISVVVNQFFDHIRKKITWC